MSRENRFRECPYGVDYTIDTTTTQSPTQVTIPAGSAVVTLAIEFLQDLVPEGTETLTVMVSPSGAYGIRTGSSTAYIRDNDAYTGAPAPSVGFANASTTIAERTGSTGTTLNIPVNITGTPAGTVTVDYVLSNGSATGRGVDYTFNNGTLSFAPGETSKNLTLVTHLDSFPEGPENVRIRLLFPTNANLGTSTHTVTITDLALPETFTDPITGLPVATVTLNGNVYANGQATNAWFEWGTSATALSTSTPPIAMGSAATSAAFSATFPPTGTLTYPSTYYYRAVAQNALGTTRGVTRIIRTVAPPVVTTLAPQGNTASTAILAGSVNPSRLNTDVWFEWGTNTSYGNTTPEVTLVQGTTTLSQQVTLTGLTEGTLYHYRMVARNAAGTVNGADFTVSAVPQTVAGDLLVNLIAKDPSAGTATWDNQGTLGDFTLAGNAYVEPFVQGTGVPGVLLQAATDYYVGPAATTAIAGNDNRSIELWVFNPGFGNEDDIVSLGRDGTRTQTVVTYNPGTDGAAKHGADDLAYTAATLPALGQWHHLVYTYSGAKSAKVYVDGVLKASKTTGGNLATTLDPILLGTTTSAAGTPNAGSFHGWINSLRIHSGELKATDVTKNYNIGPAVEAADAPLAITKGAASITPTTATLQGMVSPRGAATTAWIEWGTSTDYDNATAPVAAGSGWAPFNLSVPIAGLAVGYEYHFRVVAQNSFGITEGADAVFTPTALNTAGILWVDLRANDPTAGTNTWKNYGALGDFDSVGTNVPTLQASAAGTGLPGVEFDGFNTAYGSQSSTDADFVWNSDRTVEVWLLNPAFSGAKEAAVTLGSPSGDNGLFHLGHGSANGLIAGSNTQTWATATPPTAPALSAWHHLTAVYSGTTLTLYVDGAAVHTSQQAVGLNTWQNFVAVGAGIGVLDTLNFADAFTGYLNTVRIHGGALSAAQVLANYMVGPAYDAGDLPLATTLAPATLVTSASATLNGMVTPGGLSATAYFEWGPTASFGNVTPVRNLPNAFATQTYHEPIGGLTTGTTFHYRMVAQNVAGTATGSTQTFVATGSIVNLPGAITSAATAISAGKGTLNGTATTNGLASTAWFEYGPTTALGLSSSKVNITSGTASKVMTQPLTGLLPHTTYSFRLVVENATGKVVGSILTFVTPNLAPLAIVSSATLKEDTATVLTLKGTDGDKEALTFAVTDAPDHGTLTAGPGLTPTYTPALNYVGADSFQFTVTDGAAVSAPVTFSLTITAVNDVPLANNGVASGNEDAVGIAGTATASDPDGGSHPVTSFQIASQPANGSASINASGGFVYVPKLDFNGTDSFTFTATNVIGASAPATIVVTVAAQPDAPVATDLGYNVIKDSALTRYVFGEDADGDSLTYIKLTDPADGTISFFDTVSGEFTYQPDPGYVGVTSFTFKVNDGTSDSNVATLTITVGGPTAEDATFTGVRDDQLAGTLIAEDPNSQPLTFTKLQDPEHGTLVLNADGTFRYNPEADFVGTDAFLFSVTNGTLTSNLAEVSLIITERPPEWVWSGGPSVAKKAGVHGTQGSAAAANIPGARTDAAAWAVHSKLYVLGGNGIDGAGKAGLLNDLWAYDQATAQWTWVRGSKLNGAAGVYGAQGIPAPANEPGARSGAACWTGLDGSVWLFGGSGRDSSVKGSGLLNDLWVWDPSVNEWTWKKGSNFINANGTYGTKGLPASVNTPGARSGAVTWVDGLGRLWLFGGNGRGATGTTAGNLNDLWVYDTEANRWTWVNGSISLDANGVYATQGAPSTLNQPSGRSFATAFSDTAGLFYLFGGTGKGATGTTKGNLNDLWAYDPELNAWTWLRGSQAVNGVGVLGTLGLSGTANTPAARSGAAAWLDAQGQVWLFGGQGSKPMNDLWRFDSGSGEWAWIKGPSTGGGAGVYGTLGAGAPSNTPGARRGSIALTGWEGDLMLFGGASGTSSYSDLWRLDLDSSPLVTTLAATDILDTDATLHGEVNAGDSFVQIAFRYYPVNDPGTVQFEFASSSPPGAGIVSFDLPVTGLAESTAYIVQAVATGDAGDVFGKPVRFTTTGVPVLPEVNLSATALTVSESGRIAQVRVLLNTEATEPFTVPVLLLTGGTATTGVDYGPVPALVSFVIGQTEAIIDIPLISDGVDEADESFAIELDYPTAFADLGLNSICTFTLTDDDTVPQIVTQPVSQFAAVGSSVTLSVAATGSSLTYQWKKNGAVIKGATTSTYTLSSLTLSAAANYTCEVKNALATLLSDPAQLFVLDPVGKRVVLASGAASNTFTVTAAAPTGSTLTYDWSKDAALLADNSPHVTGDATKSLKHSLLVAGDTGIYTCLVSKTGTPALSMTSGNFTLAVPSAVPELLSIAGGPALPDGTVGSLYSYQVLVDTALTKAPTTYTASSLPPGLSINATSGLISGKPTTTGTVNVTLSAKNAINTSTVINTSLTIRALPLGVQGTYVGYAAAHDNNSRLGGRVDFSVTNTGFYTAKLTYPGKTALTGTGQINAVVTMGAVTAVNGSATLPRTGSLPLTLAFNLGLTTDILTATVYDPLVAGTATVTGYRNKWGNLPATNFTGDYTLAIDLPAAKQGDLDIPQGNGYGSFKVGLDGKLSLAGRTADGQSFTVATVTGPDGELPFYAPFTTSLGSLIGTLQITDALPAPFDNNTLAGTLAWIKKPAPTTSKDMGYRAGFDAINVTVAGGKYPVVAAGTIVMNRPELPNNFQVSFTEGGLAPDQGYPVVFTIANPGTALVQTVTPPTSTSANPEKLSFKVDAKAGAYSGGITLANPTTTLVRKPVFQGQIVHLGSNSYRTAGYMLVPQLPQPGQTLTTSPVLSATATFGPPPP